MENCLVTKLKGTVDNNNLPIFDAVRIHINSTAASSAAQSDRGFSCNAYPMTTLTLENIGGSFVNSEGQIIGDGKTLTINNTPTPTNFYYSANTTMILVKGKQNIYTLSVPDGNCTYIDFEDIGYASKLQSFAVCGAGQTGDLSDLSLLKLTSLTINGSPITGNISSLAKMTTLNYVNFLSNSIIIEGDFASWAPYYTSAKTVNVTTGSVSKLKCNGENMVNTLHKTTFTVTFDGQGGVTYA